MERWADSWPLGNQQIWTSPRHRRPRPGLAHGRPGTWQLQLTRSCPEDHAGKSAEGTPQFRQKECRDRSEASATGARARRGGPRMSVPTPPRRPPSAASSRPHLRASPAVPCASRGPKPGALAPSTPQRPAPCSAQLGVRLFQTNVISPLSEYWSSDCHRTPIPHRMPLSPRPLSRPHGREPQAHARPCPPSPLCPSTAA